ncbi:helix-turn-helix domain-containing protein [Streptomyces sp. NPDC052396]|uniref:helix-turn-helix domain-containing protein n=1 Tax=Streptomyces sp. NPDC052396 TaxID=3365689 RepID=UPI0037D6DC93
MSELSEPPMAWRLCGNQVRVWRTAANVTREQLADEAGYGPEMIKSMELGRRRPTLRFLEVADEMLGAQGKLRATYPYLEPERFASRSREYMALEAEAVAVHWYEALLVPGLLQTEGYARALMEGHLPLVDQETVESRLAARVQRTELLKKTTTAFSFVLHEAALRSGVGEAEVMKEQLCRLIELGNLRNVAIQVLPMNRGVNPGLNGQFIVLETEDRRLHGYHEAQSASMLHADPARVNDLMKCHATIRMHALNAADSSQLIRRVASEL